jgi:sugar phosphate isomerase/epimerase
MNLSTSSVMFNTLPVEQAIARIVSLGFDGVDIWQGERFKTTHLDEVVKRLGTSGLEDLLAKHRLQLAAFTCYLGIPIEPYVEILGKVGKGRGVLVRESEYTRGAPIGDIAARMRALRDQLQPQIALAEKHNFSIAIENHSGAILNTLDSLKAFLEIVDHPRVGVGIAPYHLQKAGIAVEDAIALAGKRLLFFYAWQDAPDAKQLPGIGPTDFTPWLRALAAVNYTGHVNPFMHGENQDMAKSVLESRRYLERCRSNMMKTP